MKTTCDADVTHIQQSLRILYQTGDIVELRAFRHKRCTVSGYYSDLDLLAQDAVTLNRQCGNTYSTLNQV